MAPRVWLLVLAWSASMHAFTPRPLPAVLRRGGAAATAATRPAPLLAQQGDEQGGEPKLSEEVVEATEKYGLEGGLFKSWQKGDLPQAGELLKQYGAAYLITSISFAIVSFSVCYALVDSGVDVGALLSKVNINVDVGSMGERAGTAAIAYAMHKAASPIRFPPTVALTPVVAQWLKKDKAAEDA